MFLCLSAFFHILLLWQLLWWSFWGFFCARCNLFYLKFTKLQCSGASKNYKGYLCVNDLICLQLYFYMFHKNIRSFVSTYQWDSHWIKSYTNVTKMQKSYFNLFKSVKCLFSSSSNQKKMKKAGDQFKMGQGYVLGVLCIL